MGRAMAGLIMAATLLMCCANTMALGYNEDEATAPDLAHVAGKVLCQDCTQGGWNEWIQGTPIKGSVVSITCMDERGRTVQYSSDDTDEYGRFDFAVKLRCGSTGKRIDPKGCRARLVSSPDPSCNVLTNFGGGVTGVGLDRPSSMYRDTVKYRLEPFYFTSPMCEKPDVDGDSPAGGGYGNNGHY